MPAYHSVLYGSAGAAPVGSCAGRECASTASCLPAKAVNIVLWPSLRAQPVAGGSTSRQAFKRAHRVEATSSADAPSAKPCTASIAGFMPASSPGASPRGVDPRSSSGPRAAPPAAGGGASAAGGACGAAGCAIGPKLCPSCAVHLYEVTKGEACLRGLGRGGAVSRRSSSGRGGGRQAGDRGGQRGQLGGEQAGG